MDGDRIVKLCAAGRTTHFTEGLSGRERALYRGSARRLLAGTPFLDHRGTALSGATAGRQGYPHDNYRAASLTKGDNGPPDEGVMPHGARSLEQEICLSQAHYSYHERGVSGSKKEYGDKLQTHRGDLTPYWEDGAASSARDGQSTVIPPIVHAGWRRSGRCVVIRPIPGEGIRGGSEERRSTANTPGARA